MRWRLRGRESQTGLCDDRHQRADMEAGRSLGGHRGRCQACPDRPGHRGDTGIAAALPGLDRFGKLPAIEVFEACGDHQAGPALVSLLSDAGTTVREWAAKALGALGYTEVGPALARLDARLLRDLVPPRLHRAGCRSQRPDALRPAAARDARPDLDTGARHRSRAPCTS